MSPFHPIRLAVLILSSCGLLAAQTSGILRGTVVDPSGAAVPNASIILTGPNNVAKAAETDASGTYNVPALLPGEYAVRAAAAGFEVFQGALNVPGGRVSTLDIHLTVAQGRQEITVVEAQQTQLALDPAQNATALVVTDKDLDALSDNPDDLQADLLALAGPSVGPSGGQIFVDGFSNGQLPPKESIREVRVNSNPFSSEYDRPGTGRIEIITKPGADKFRGGASVNFADNVLNARDPYSLVKPSTQMRQFQGDVAGPLSKSASFTFDGGHQTVDATSLIVADILDSSFQPQHVNQIVRTPGTRTFLSPRLDYQITSNVTLQGRYYNNSGSNDNNGIGGFSLLSRATKYSYTNQGGQFTETAVIGTRMVNETRVQYSRYRYDSSGDSLTPAINVLGAFTGGGAPISRTYTDYRGFEIQNNTSYTRGRHLVKFGVRVRGSLEDSYSTSNYNGTYTFTSLAAYALTEQGLAQGLSMDQIRSQGGGASQYSVTGGTPLTGVRQYDEGPYIQDDWRVVPNLTLSLGMRYEIQTNIRDNRDWAPRASLAWGIGHGQGSGSAPKTVLRLGYGIFYDRIGQDLTLQTLRQNGVTQQNFLVTDPAFFGPAPPVSQLVANRLPQAIQIMDSLIRSPQTFQGAVSLERQLPKNITLSVSYTNSRGVHQLRSRNINAPLPGTGFLPYYGQGQLYLYESSAVFDQRQLTVNVNARVNKRVSLFGYYSYNHVYSNSDGAGSFPVNNYDLSTEWGRAGFDVRHRVQLGGNVTLPGGILISPNVSANSAPPVNITTGEDNNRDTNFNDRPAFATVPANPALGVFATPWGVFNRELVSNPAAGSRMIPRNYGYGYGAVNINGRISKTWTFGERAAKSAPGRYGFTLGLQARNWINHVNPSQPVANLSSPFLGQALNSQLGSTSNRRFEANARFSF